MTPSGPILGLNKRWKIKLHSKLQPACSRTVYQQCVRNQRREEKKNKGWDVFFYSSVVLLNFCCIFILLWIWREALRSFKWAHLSFLVSSVRVLTEGGDDLRWDIQVGERASPSLTSGRQVYQSPPQLSHISAPRVAGGMNQARHHSLCPGLLNLLPLSTQVLRQAITATMAPHSLGLSAGFEWLSER